MPGLIKLKRIVWQLHIFFIFIFSMLLRLYVYFSLQNILKKYIRSNRTNQKLLETQLAEQRRSANDPMGGRGFGIAKQQHGHHKVGAVACGGQDSPPLCRLVQGTKVVVAIGQVNPLKRL